MPVVFRHDGFRFFFFSNEGDPREPVHVHVRKSDGEAKLWRVNLDERAATIKMALQRSRRDDDCRAATITQAVFSSSSI